MNNREIKFRVWDSNEKKFLLPEWADGMMITLRGVVGYYSDIDDADDGIIQNGKAYFPEQKFISKGFELSRFTGMKDKNGKDIYEGDILHGREEGDGETTAWTDVYYIVFFKNAGFYVREKSIKEDSSWCDHLSDNDIVDYYEVVGNIYENPELLNQKNEKRN